MMLKFKPILTIMPDAQSQLWSEIQIAARLGFVL